MSKSSKRRRVSPDSVVDIGQLELMTEISDYHLIECINKWIPNYVSFGDMIRFVPLCVSAGNLLLLLMCGEVLTLEI